MRRKIIFLLMSFFMFSLASYAQDGEKREYEQSVRMDEIPGSIIELLSPFLDQAKKIKFFKESDGEKTTWEVKMKFQGRHFSIEFFEDHSLKDIEELVKWNHLEGEARSRLESYFESNYQRFRIKRLQKQTQPGNGIDTKEFITKILHNNDSVPFGYEIEAEVRSQDNREFGFFEYRFDSNFQLLSKRRIIPVPDGNLLF